MMIHEPKCILWKRLGAEKVMLKIQGLNTSQELEFWRKQTEKLKAAQQDIRNNWLNK